MESSAEFNSGEDARCLPGTQARDAGKILKGRSPVDAMESDVFVKNRVRDGERGTTCETRAD